MGGNLVIAGFLVLLLIGFPISFSLALPTIIYILIGPVSISLIAQRVFFSLDSVPLIAVPLFMLVGNVMNYSGISDHIFRFARSLVSHWYGGLAQVNILASLIFAGTSGSALADIGGLGRIEIKAMVEAGYSKAFSCAITIASATVGPIFPPSIPLVLFGVFGSVSTIELLIAGICPSIIIVISLMVTTFFIARKRKFPRSKKREPFNEIFTAGRNAFPALLAPLFLILGMLSGIFSPTEAAAVTLIYIIIMSIIFYRSFRWTNIINASRETAKTLPPLIFIVISAKLFIRILTTEQIIQSFSEKVISISDNRIILLFVINVLLLFIGCFIDTVGALLLTTPIVLPILVAVGVDPVHVGVIVVYNLMIGSLTPPVGMSLFLVSNLTNVKVTSILKELLPYYLPLGVSLLVITYWPQMVLWLPKLIR